MRKMNTNGQDLLKMLKEDDAVLVVDNDMCYVRFNDDDREEDGESFDFTPTELVFILAEALEFEVEMC
jgi:hypothetical protein